MTLIEMAKQALTSLSPDEYSDEPYWSASNEELKRFANLIRADERTANIACIGRIAAFVGDPIDQARLHEAMDAIRARGENE
jgi:hypothetical protein